jgi:ATP-binding cassette subfamily B protein
VDVREAASNALAGHLADSISNAEVVRAFASEPDEAAHSRAQREGLRREDAALLGLPELPHRHDHLADVVATNILGLVAALATRGSSSASLEAVFITFSYYSHGHARDVGVQPDLPEHGGRDHRRRAVRRSLLDRRS